MKSTSETPIRILLVDDDTAHCETIRKLLSFEPDMHYVGTALDGQEAVEQARVLHPDIVLMDINMPQMDGLSASEAIIRQFPNIQIIVMSIQDDPSYIRESMMAGARFYLNKPINPDELYSTIRKVHQLPKTRLPQTEPLTPPKPKGKVITVYSPQGGAGCTTVAVNLACGLMRDGKRVLLVDTDMQFGDVDVLLYLPTGTTLADLVERTDDLDVDFVEEIVATHRTGLRVLMGVGGLTDALALRSTPDNVIKTLNQLADSYDYIVVDTASVMDDLTLKLFERSDRILLVSRPTLTGVKHLRTIFNVLDNFSGAHGKQELILNAVPAETGHHRETLPVSKIEDVLKEPVIAQIPQDAVTLHNAMLKGVPLLAYDHRENLPITRAYLALLEHLHQSMILKRDFHNA